MKLSESVRILHSFNVLGNNQRIFSRVSGKFLYDTGTGDLNDGTYIQPSLSLWANEFQASEWFFSRKKNQV